MKTFLFFDTETTGLPRNYKAPASDINNWPRVIQLAWVLYDENFIPLNKRCELVQPNGWTMPTDKFWIDNGYSQERSQAVGVPIEHLLKDFADKVKKADYLIAHNLDFDTKVIGAEYHRSGVSVSGKPGMKRYCTKESSTNFCKLPGSYGSYKWPKLEELHMKLFEESFEGAHDALVDVEACARCFKELVSLRIITL